MTNSVWPANTVGANPTYAGRILRQTTVAPFVAGATAARPLGARSGVRPGTPATTVTATSTTWTVQPHVGVIDVPTFAVEAGPFTYAVDAVTTGAVTAASASYPRKDLVYIRLDDPVEDGGASSTPGATPLYVAGTSLSGGTLVVPTPPARSLILAEINVPISGGGSPSVTWVAPYAVAAGGIVPGVTAASFGAGQYVGQYIDDPTLGLLRWDGTAWQTAGSGSIATYTPTVTGSVSPPGVGNGTLSGAYKILSPKLMWFRIAFALGSTSSGGTGEWAFGLPPGITAAAGLEQVVSCKAYTVGGNLNGYGYLPALSATVRPFLPSNLSSNVMAQARNADNTNAAGTGVPQIAGAYPFGNGHNVVIEGTVQIA